MDKTQLFRKSKSVWAYTAFPLFGGKQFGEKMKEKRPGITHGAGSSFISSCKGLSEPLWREDDDTLTLANQKNIAVTRCEVNITRK